MGTGHNLSLRHIAKSEDEFIGMKSSMFQSNKCLESKSTKKVDVCFQPGSNRRPCACEAHVITTTLWKLEWKLLTSTNQCGSSAQIHWSSQILWDIRIVYSSLCQTLCMHFTFAQSALRMEKYRNKDANSFWFPFMQIYAAKGNAPWDESKLGLCLS